MELKNFIGTWKSNSLIADDLKYTFFISNDGIAKLWFVNNQGKTETLSEGKIDFKNNNDDSFEIIISGDSQLGRFSSFDCRLHMKDEQESFLMSNADFNERLFIKIK